MRVADFIVETLARKGIEDIFLVPGGGAMHLNDAFGRCKALEYVACHHEQACAMAAEGHARISGEPALLCVTSGPGAINALNGVFGAYTDSIPMLVLSGQVRTDTLVEACPQLELRQLGDQEARSDRFLPAFVKRFHSLRAADDPIAVIEIQHIIGHLRDRGIGVLITDHNVRETLGICDRAYIISEGRVLAEGRPADIINNAEVRKVYLGEHFRM